MKNKRNLKRGKIYVVGFPKSGNTWLVRLLARVLKAKVVKYAMDNSTPEVAADINEEIEISSVYSISKIHFVPKKFLEKFKIGKYDRIVYIKRNIYDVLVSSFFYFRYKGDEKYILKWPSIDILLNPFKLYNYYNGRSFFSRYIKEFCINGHRDHGKWEDHLFLWKDFLKKNRNVKSSITLYESLLSDTGAELLRILRDLDLDYIDKNTIERTIKEESFEERKKRIFSTKKELTFGKEFNIKFLRKGNTGDYQRFLHAKQIKYIKNMLREGILDCFFLKE